MLGQAKKTGRKMLYQRHKPPSFSCFSCCSHRAASRGPSRDVRPSPWISPMQTPPCCCSCSCSSSILTWPAAATAPAESPFLWRGQAHGSLIPPGFPEDSTDDPRQPPGYQTSLLPPPPPRTAPILVQRLLSPTPALGQRPSERAAVWPRARGREAARGARARRPRAGARFLRLTPQPARHVKTLQRRDQDKKSRGCR